MRLTVARVLLPPAWAPHMDGRRRTTCRSRLSDCVKRTEVLRWEQCTAAALWPSPPPAQLLRATRLPDRWT